MMTSIYKSVKYQYEGMRYGANDFIHKPFELEVFLDKIGRYAEADHPRPAARKLSPAAQAGWMPCAANSPPSCPSRPRRSRCSGKTSLQGGRPGGRRAVHPRA